MRDYVLIVAAAGDVHALAVAALIEDAGVEAFVWDSARLPAADQFTQYLSSAGSATAILETEALGSIDLSRARSVWWRRPRPPTIPNDIRDDLTRAYCRHETMQLLRGVLSLLGPIVHNDPDSEERAQRKAYHLRVAADVGLSVVPTLMTSSPERVRAFRQEVGDGGIVFKPFVAPSGSACATRLFVDEYDDALSLLANAPVIFQRVVPPKYDVRVSVVGTEIFAGISASESLDWRVDSDLVWTAHELPSRLKSRILELMRRLNLTMGHLDFRIAPDGDYIFFEINPSGQFLFLELHDRDLAITSEIANFLIRSGGRSSVTQYR